jgi:putative flippase GtrA
MQPELATQADQGLMGAASALAHRLHLPTTLMKFLIVGGIAFVIYQVFLYLLYGEPPASFFPDLTGLFWFLPDPNPDSGLFNPDMRLLISSIVAVEAAVVFQFNSHERWTFRHRPRQGWIGLRFIKFNISSIVSPIIIVVTTIVLHALDVSPYVSSIVGVLIGFAWNWTVNSLVIWQKHQPAPLAIGAATDDDLRTA